MVGRTERSPLVEGPPLAVDSENLPPLPLPQPHIPVEEGWPTLPQIGKRLQTTTGSSP